MFFLLFLYRLLLHQNLLTAYHLKLVFHGMKNLSFIYIFFHIYNKNKE